MQTFKQCPYRYKLRYIDKLKTLPTQDPASPLILGTALHKGLETDVKQAIDLYRSSYYQITDKHINEEMKLEDLIPKAKALLPSGKHEVKIETEDFIGYIDLITEEGDIYDFKYSNGVARYLDSYQLHVYREYSEANGRLFYLFVPKTSIRQKKTETLQKFRMRLRETLSTMRPEIREVEFSIDRVAEYHRDCDITLAATDFPKNEGRLCDWCEYKDYCLKGLDYGIA